MKGTIVFRTLTCVLLAGAALCPSASAGEKGSGLSAASVDYMTSGRFAAADKEFHAEDFVSIVAPLPALEKESPELHNRIVRAIETDAPDKGGQLMEYLGLYKSDACKELHVRTNLDQMKLEDFHKALILGSESLHLGCEALKKGDLEQARKDLDTAIEADPRYAAAYLHRAIVKARTGDPQGAGADYRESLKTPGDVRFDVRRCLCDGSLKAGADKLAGSFEGGAKAKKAGVDLFLKGNVKSAIAKLDESIELAPSDPEAYMSRAVAREASGDEANALGDYQLASQLAVDSARWDLAADALDGSTRLGSKDIEKLTRIVEGYNSLLTAAPEMWERRGTVNSKYEQLSKRLPKKPEPKTAPEGPKEDMPEDRDEENPGERKRD